MGGAELCASDRSLSLSGSHLLCRPVCISAVIATLLSGLSVSSAALMGGGDIPGYAIKVAGRQADDGASWGIWIFGTRRGRQCWATRIFDRGELQSGGVNCGFSVPRRPWQFAVGGTVGGAGDRESVLFFLTSTDVADIEAQVVGSRWQEPHWVRVTGRALTTNQLRTARLQHGIGYALRLVPGVVRLRRFGAASSNGRSRQRQKP